MPGSRGSETLADKNEEATRWVFNCLHPRQRQFNSARLSAQAATDACQGSKNMVTSHINPPSAVQLYSDDERRLFSSQISARQIWRRLKSHSLTKTWSKKWRFVKIEAVGKRRRQWCGSFDLSAALTLLTRDREGFKVNTFYLTDIKKKPGYL